jgi:hypothetical protein
MVGTRVPEVEKIAVLRANALGDYLFRLPALESLRAAYPQAEIVLLGAQPVPDRALGAGQEPGRGRTRTAPHPLGRS